MDKTLIRKTFLPVFFIFIVFDTFFIVFRNWFVTHQIDELALIGANIILFLLTILTLYMFYRSLQNPNPNVFVRTIMASTILKLFFIAGSVMAYGYFTRAYHNLSPMIGTMILYIIYTVTEIRGALFMNRYKK